MFHQHVPHVAELGGLTVALLKELRLRLVGGDMRLVRAPLAVEVHVRVPSRRRRIFLPIPTAHAFDCRPRLDEGPIDAEVLRGEQDLAPGSRPMRRRSLRATPPRSVGRGSW